MIIKGRYNVGGVIDLSRVTNHIKERKDRILKYLSIKVLGDVYDSFKVDKGHINGGEIHVITTNGYILIFNSITYRFVTILHARPMQLKRYYLGMNEEIPETINRIGELNSELNRTMNLNSI